MLIKYALIVVLCFAVTGIRAQHKNHLSLEVNYGLQGNFFVRSYDEYEGPENYNFYNKNFIGTIGGMELNYHFGNKSSLGLGYARSVNSRTVNYEDMGFAAGGANLLITDFRIRHINNFFQLFYQYSIGKKSTGLALQGGIYYLTPSQQTISIAGQSAFQFDEGNNANSNLNEAGIFFGIQYSRMIDSKFELGIKSRIYYTLSAGYLEAVSLTPRLAYHFGQKKL